MLPTAGSYLGFTLFACGEIPKKKPKGTDRRTGGQEWETRRNPDGQLVWEPRIDSQKKIPFCWQSVMTDGEFLVLVFF